MVQKFERISPCKSLRQALLFFVVTLGLISVLLLPWEIFSPSFANAAHSQDKVSAATVEGRLAIFDDVWQTIHDRYYDPQLRGVDWDHQREVLRPEAAMAATPTELYAVLRRLVGSLNDVHTRVFGPEEKFEWWNPRFVSIGLTVREIEGFPTVVQVEKGSGPDQAGIRPGDVIEKIDGMPALSLIDQRFLRQPAAAIRPASRLRAFATLFEGAPQTSVEILWRRKSGELRAARFEREWRGRQLGLKVDRARGKYVVVAVDGFTPSIALEFTRVMKRQLKNASGVVLDLRSNGGGEAEAMADVASTFLGEGASLGAFTDRWGMSFTITTRAKSLLAHDMLTQTNLPLTVLISERTSSAAEIFAAAMQSAGRAKIIGADTCGCVLAIRNQHTLPDGGVLDVSELDYRTSSGVRLEENGIKPDLRVQVRRQDFYSNEDRALEHALDILASTPASVARKR